MNRLAARLNKIEATGGQDRTALIWVDPDDSQEDIAARIEECKSAAPDVRFDFQLLGWEA